MGRSGADAPVRSRPPGRLLVCPASRVRLTTSSRPLHLEGRRRFGVIRGVTGALNWMRRQKVEKSILEISAIDVYANDFSDRQVLVERQAVNAMQLYNLHQLAFNLNPAV